MKASQMQTDQQPIKVGLVGCGAVSQLYYQPALQALQHSNLLQVQAVFDPNTASAYRLLGSFPNAIAVENINAIANQVDLAIVASPPQYHASQTIHLLQAGCSVLCEKPMANTISEAEAMLDAAAQSSKQLAIGLFRRFFPATQTIHKILSLGWLGEIESITCTEGGIFNWPVQSPAYFQRSQASGGVLLDIGIHLLDLLIWWFGYPTSFIYADDAMGGIDVNCQISLTFGQNIKADVRLSRDCILPNHYLIKGSNGWLRWEVNVADKLQMGFHDSAKVMDINLNEYNLIGNSPQLIRPAFNFEQSFTSQIVNVIAAMRGLEPLTVPAEVAIHSLKLIAACYQHRQLMPMPWLSTEEQTQAQHLSLQGAIC